MANKNTNMPTNFSFLGIVIWSQNIECLTTHKLGELSHLMKRDKPHIVLIQETWLKPNKQTDADVSIPGYSIFRKDRIASEHGGIVSYVREDICVSYIEENVKSKDHEVLWLRIQSSTRTLFVANVYRPPPSDNSIFDALAADIEHFQRKTTRSNILLVGDFNCHHSTWLGSRDVHGAPKTNDAGSSCFSLCQILGLTNVVNGNTFLRNTGGAVSTLDLVLTDSSDSVSNVTLETPVGISPHSRVAFTFKMSPKTHKTYNKISWLYHRANWEDLCKSLKLCDWIVNHDVNQSWEKAKSNIQQAMNHFIPKKVIKRNSNDQPWFTDKCAIACFYKQKMWFQYKKAPSEETKERYNKSRLAAEEVYRKARSFYAVNIQKKLSENAGDPRAWWRIVNHISGKGGQSAIPTLHYDGISYETATDKAEVFKKNFASKSNIDDKSKIPPPCSNFASSSLNNIKIRAKVVKTKLLHLKSSKATGPDGIPARVLRECADVLSKPLSSLFSLSLFHGVVPKEWKCANVIPIYKADGKSDPNNYRPISLLPIISKVMESIINDHLRKHLFGLRLISNHQFGFRPKHSTLDLLTCATQGWERALDKGQEIKVVALDISRAFDSVWHNGLMSKLMSAGVGGYVYRWIRDFLNDRFIRVVVNGRESSAVSINAGVPQGSILGPTLFLIFINDLSQVLSSTVCMFADDTTISAIVPNIKSRNDVASILSNDLRNVEAWAESWLVKFNAKKTQLMTISRKINKDKNKICFLGETLKQENSIKLLGVHITNTLDWGYHVDKVAKRAGQHLGILRKAKKLLPSTALATLYKTRVRSAMEYCCPIWQNAPKFALQKMDAIQRKACRLMGIDQDVCPAMNIQSLEHRRNVSGLCQLHRMVSGTAPIDVIDLLPPFIQPSKVSRYVLQSHHFQLDIKRSRTAHHMNSFIPSMARSWNSLPNSCIYGNHGDLMSLQTFKKNVNTWLQTSVLC